MTRQELIALIRERRSFLCVGLDTDPAKMPEHLRNERDGIFRFNRAIIDATIDHCVAYKPNLAFYEALGLEGMRQLKLTMDYLHSLGKPVFTIADAKRGDIGNTSERYAHAFLDPRGDFNFDAITVAPYMGADSVQPFLAVEGKWVILLALTSNKGAFDFQLTEDRDGCPLYQRVLETSRQWGNEDNMMYVVGATKAEMLGDVRRIVPGSFLLVPGVGAQGGSLEEVCRHGLNA
ncbi:MAG: orotidine-5'-phosphate decarboxylase, partial [Bacteroidaceae bacterium]|nr:orotidine-5'-phosphate decarboxylase [Bacteroidaceae bacterium]